MVQSINLTHKHMATATKSPLADRNVSNDSPKVSEEYETHVGDMIFEFLEESELSSGSSLTSGDSYDDGDFEQNDDSGDPEEKRLFWESQEQLLTKNLYKTSSFESKIRQATKEIIKEMKSSAVGCCDCGMMTADGCQKCFQKEISDRLQQAGYNCSVCKAKWSNLKEIPAGEHTYIDVLGTSNSKKGVLRVIIELNFRAEFEMVKGSEEYNHLVNRLPELYVGKIERLQSLIKILCLASKKCMKDQKMHIAPWRKLKYMQAKWLGVRTSKLVSLEQLPQVVSRTTHLSRPMVSLLTFDLVESLKISSSLQPMAIKVL